MKKRRDLAGALAGSLVCCGCDCVDSFYQSPRWEHKRRAILRRDGYMCQECKRYGRTRQATTVHHVKHLDDYPELAYTDSNLVSLCARCHNTMHPEKGGRRV